MTVAHIAIGRTRLATDFRRQPSAIALARQAMIAKQEARNRRNATLCLFGAICGLAIACGGLLAALGVLA